MTDENKKSNPTSCSLDSNKSKVGDALKKMPVENKIPEHAIRAIKSLAKSNKKYLR